MTRGYGLSTPLPSGRFGHGVEGLRNLPLDQRVRPLVSLAAGQQPPTANAQKRREQRKRSVDPDEGIVGAVDFVSKERATSTNPIAAASTVANST
jgi:hypothetical protein